MISVKGAFDMVILFVVDFGNIFRNFIHLRERERDRERER